MGKRIDIARRDPAEYPAALQPVPRTTLTFEEAAASCGVSKAHFERHIKPELKIVYSGGARLVPVVELARWADKQARMAGAA